MKKITDKDLEETEFGNNKFFNEIIKTFINQYSEIINYSNYGDLDSPNNNKVDIANNVIKFYGEDRAGSRDITITIKDENLVIDLNRLSIPYRFKTILVYDNYGVMLRRINWSGLLKDKIDSNININDLDLEYDYLEENGNNIIEKLFNSFDYKEVKRPDNYGLTGKYFHRNMKMLENGEKEDGILEGEFRVLESSSISSLEFPSEEKITVIRNHNYKQQSNENVYFPYRR